MIPVTFILGEDSKNVRVQSDPGKPGKHGKSAYFEKTQGKPGKLREKKLKIGMTQGKLREFFWLA